MFQKKLCEPHLDALQEAFGDAGGYLVDEV